MYAFHKISHEQAVQDGNALEDVLREFMADVTHACESGGRVVAHQLEFDAGVIYEELGRCGLDALRDEWACIARKGYCTMNHVVGRWLLECSGSEVGPPMVHHTLRLDVMLRLLLPQHSAMLAEWHDARADAQMTRLIYVAMLSRLQPPPPTEKNT